MLLGSLGSVLVLVGAVWLIVIAVQTGQTTSEKVLWALVNFFCQPLGGIIFYFVRKQGLVPLLLMLAGCIISGIGWFPVMDGIIRQPTVG
jgi:hypothetical protein